MCDEWKMCTLTRKSRRIISCLDFSFMISYFLCPEVFYILERNYDTYVWYSLHFTLFYVLFCEQFRKIMKKCKTLIVKIWEKQVYVCKILSIAEITSTEWEKYVEDLRRKEYWIKWSNMFYFSYQMVTK